MLPIVIVTAPFVLTAMAIQEALQRCPHCGRQGTLKRVHLEPPPTTSGFLRQGDPVESEQDWRETQWEDLRRVNPDSVVWQCEVCGGQFRQDRALTRITP